LLTALARPAMHPALPALLGLTLLLAGAVSAQSSADCSRQADEGLQRAQRDMARQAPPQGDREGQQRWAKALNEQLEAVNRRYEDCRRTAERQANPQAACKEMACAQASHRQADELHKRYAHRTPSAAGHKAMRDEEMAILDARQACLLKAGRS
jgi:hypothetical protein